ncbi:MAG: chloride channel protein, partial [Phycisphaerae bacterium]
ASIQVSEGMLGRVINPLGEPMDGSGPITGETFEMPLERKAPSVLYREPEFESDAIVPAFVASVIGYSTFMLFPGFGGRMLDGADTLAFRHPLELTAYAVLGPLCGGLSIFFSACMRGVERRAEAWSRVPRWLWPAVGGLATGALALVLPQVMDGRYRFIQNTMDAARDATLAPDGGWLWWAGLFGAVALFKCVATALTVGTGASGGVLGPSVFIGGAAGAFLGAMCEAIHPGVLTPELRCALIPVGMAGVLSASMRTPLAAIVMVTEMTGSYGLIVPLMVVCVGAYLTGRRWGLNHEQVRTTAESPAHAADALVHMLESWRVSELMERNWPESVVPDATLSELVTRIRPGTRPVFAVVERAERDRVLLGVISVPDIRRIMDEPGLADALIASDIMTQRVATIHPDDDVYRVLDVFRREHHDVLPVVSRDHHRRWLGMLTRTRVFEAVQRRIADMHQSALREHTGLAAIEQEAHMQQLMLGVSAERSDKIQRLLVPLQAVGQSLRDADFRRQFGVQVIAIEQPDGTMQCPPDIDAPLRTEQRLVAIVGDEPGGRNADAPADTSRPKRDT